MGLGNILILSQTTVFVINFIFSFFIFIPMTVCLAQFNGKCLLFASGNWTENQNPDPKEQNYLLHVDWEDSGPCNLVLFAGAFTMPLSLLYILFMGVYLFKATEPSWLAAFIGMLASAFCNIMVLCAGIVVTAGFNDWCNLITQSPHGMESCDMAEFSNFLQDGKSINLLGFYMEICMTIFGLWSSWICWVLLTVFAIIQLCRYHRQEDFLISIARERERLIQKVSSRSFQAI